jgi:hypothetical protein
MDKSKQLMQEIIKITAQIETRYPELYKFLDETPFSLKNTVGQEFSERDLESYLDTLKDQLGNYMQLHNKKANAADIQ